MSDMSTLRFGDPKQPDTEGALVLGDDGSLRIVPSDAMRDGLAEQEEKALRLAKVYGTELGAAMILLGVCAVAAGWYAGRVFGKAAGKLLWPHDVRKVIVERDDHGNIVLQHRAKHWRGGFCEQTEFENFQTLTEEMKQI